MGRRRLELASSGCAPGRENSGGRNSNGSASQQSPATLIDEISHGFAFQPKVKA
jgi:hypothetical protein